MVETLNFHQIRWDEIEAINRRRQASGRDDVKWLDRAGHESDPMMSDATPNLSGLALSGGGIRSASFCLGVLQGLNHHSCLPRIDYLSSVSGGGYIGASLTSSMTASNGDFAFGESAPTQAGPVQAAEIADTEAVGHIRNYSNYLIPAGLRDVITGVAIVLRGLVANAALIAPFGLAAAALTIWANPDRSALTRPDIFGWDISHLLPVANFGLTLVIFLVGLLLMLLWACKRSALAVDRLSEFKGHSSRIAAFGLIGLATVAFLELQPFVIEGMFAAARPGSGDAQSLGAFAGWLKGLAVLAAPVMALGAFFRQSLADVVKKAASIPGIMVKIKAALSMVALWAAALALPVILWVIYLYLCYWGIIDDTVEGAARGAHTPGWLIKTASALSWIVSWIPWFGDIAVARPMAILYLVAGALLLAAAWRLTPNANSLHRLYRDRLSKAFLFNHQRGSRQGGAMARNDTSRDKGRDFEPLDAMKLSALSTLRAPYHLINMALNVQGSDFANRRGRNADFFLMSPLHVGSVATGYVPTTDMERAAPALDVATAMAISGAAASSNMGSNSIRPLTPTLAILNIRLGYWLPNPMFVNDPVAGAEARRSSLVYLWSEMTGRLFETSDEIYLTDGGHIENLGVYELLKRKCRTIIVVDSEADPAMSFGALIKLERYARLDLGVRIELPWQRIRDVTLASMGQAGIAATVAGRGDCAGPHAAVGIIDYGKGARGYLIYVKASLTGDENDYVRDYARRHAAFPHETTGDQFFSEEQFEVYRALGFHSINRILQGQDVVAAPDSVAGENFLTSADMVITELRKALVTA